MVAVCTREAGSGQRATNIASFLSAAALRQIIFYPLSCWTFFFRSLSSFRAHMYIYAIFVSENTAEQGERGQATTSYCCAFTSLVVLLL